MKPNRTRLTILEWAPAADALYTFRQDPLHGYTRREKGTIQIGQGVKLRPDIQAYYAGGKATNVARVLDRLLDPQIDQALWDEKTQTFRVELVTLLPDTPAGRFIGDLQRTEMNRVQLRFEDAPGEARICVNLADPGTHKTPDGLVEFNLSPYVTWPGATDALLEKVVKELAPHWLILAGKPPEGAGLSENLTAHLVAQVKQRQPDTLVSLDVGGSKNPDWGTQQLERCLQAEFPPDALLINQQEYAAVDPSLWASFAGTLVMHDAQGCWFRQGPGASAFDPLKTARDVPALAQEVHATIGAGDAAHAGFALGWIRTQDLRQAVLYSQAVAAAAVSQPLATSGVTAAQVKAFWDRIAP